MTDELRELAGRCLMVGAPGPELSDEFARLLEENLIGNVVLFARSTPDLETTARLTGRLRELRGPMLIAADQEGGRVQRLRVGVTALPSAMALGAAGPEHVEAVCRLAGSELRAAGINMNLAPVLDVNSNPRNPVIGTRSFGSSAAVVAECGRAAVRGYRGAGVISCGKHFPGHGSSEVDSHLALATIESAELEPFAAAIEEGVDSIMTGHLAVPAIDASGLPASMSGPITTGLLLRQMGFGGVVCTDCLEMEGAAGGEFGELAVRAFLAGNDLLVISHTPSRYAAAATALTGAVRSGRIPESRIRESAARVESLQRRAEAGGRPEADPMAARRAARAAVRVVRGAERLPLTAGGARVVGLGGGSGALVEDPGRSDGFAAAARRRGCDGSGRRLVLGTRRLALNPTELEEARRLRPEVVVALDLPQDVDLVPEAPVAVVAFGDSPELLEAVLDLLFGPGTGH